MNSDLALVVDRLIRDDYEIAGTHTRVGGEKAPGSGLEDGHADNITYSEAECLRRTPVGERRR
jgi:hypothetical protein